MTQRKSPALIAPQRKKKTETALSAQRIIRHSAKPPRKNNIGLLRRFWRMVWRIFLWLFLRITLAICAFLAAFTLYYLSILPEAGALMDDRQRGSVTMLDRNGDIFAWRGDQFGGIVTSDTISSNLRNAVIATEDKRFYSHFGLSLRGIAGAVRTNLREGRSALRGHGGSTITQQVAKQIFFADLPMLDRKLREVPMALAMELKYTKDQILAIYLNRAYLGNGSYGFAAAARRYFGRSASDVTPAQAAMLAGLLKAPSTANPIRNFDRAHKRANLILGLMENQGYLTAQQTEHARKNPAQLSQAASKKAGGYFADWILESAPNFIIKDANADVIIHTTYDQGVQTAAEEALNTTFAKLKSGSRAQGAIVVMSYDGAVRAVVGGRKNQFAGAFNRATQALRQTGSAFKPFVYAAALESGLRYDDLIDDRPIEIELRGQPSYSPRNYDGEFVGPITLTQAFAQSRNSPAVQLSEKVGRARVRALARDFGIVNEIPSGPSLALGAGEATLMEMVGAYAGIANHGQLIAPYGLLELTIQGDANPLLEKQAQSGYKIISDFTAQQLIYMMRQVIESGTGQRARLSDRQVAGKTGTTQGARDAWFIGFSADYIAGVWMGYDDNTPLTGVTGGGLPAQIWHDTMAAIHADLPARPLQLSQYPDVLVGPSQVLSIEQQILNDLQENEAKKNTGLGALLRRIFN